MTDLACSSCGRAIVPATSEVTSGLCRPCHKKELLRRRKASAQSQVQMDDPGLTPDRAHEAARKLMTEPWFWSLSDDNSPFGNDTGADTLAFFQQWRATNGAAMPSVFLSQLLARWQVRNGDWNVRDEDRLRADLRENHFHVLTRDDIVIALAFAQLAIEGRVEDAILERARLALGRQTLPSVIAFRGWVDPGERVERLARMKGVLDSVGATEGARK